MKDFKYFFLGLTGLIVFAVIYKKDEIVKYIQENDTLSSIFKTIQEEKDKVVEYVQGNEILNPILEAIQKGAETVISGFDSIYQKWSEALGIDWKLVKAVAITESDEDPTVIGDNGNSFGLMQVQNLIGNFYANAKGQELLDPEKNVEAGSKYLAEMIRKYGTEGGIQAYNLGETKYKAGLTSPTYLSKVMKNFNSLQEIA
jgi:soluble lytic murein transglycosylase-like protein